jgi:hypothetical protein
MDDGDESSLARVTLGHFVAAVIREWRSWAGASTHEHCLQPAGRRRRRDHHNCRACRHDLECVPAPHPRVGSPPADCRALDIRNRRPPHPGVSGHRSAAARPNPAWTRRPRRLPSHPTFDWCGPRPCCAARKPRSDGRNCTRWPCNALVWTVAVEIVLVVGRKTRRRRRDQRVALGRSISANAHLRPVLSICPSVDPRSVAWRQMVRASWRRISDARR